MSDQIIIPYDPNDKQKLFHACGATEVVYGGSKGGGKTCALVIEAAAYGMENPGATIYIFRETYDDLESNIINEWKKRIPPELYKYNEQKHRVSLHNGTEVLFRYVKSKVDAEQYDGRSIDWIGVDELTKHEEATIQQLLSCLRSAKGFPVRFRGTCNPGGIGHNWVKKRYITPTLKGKRGYRDPVSGNEIKFIPAKVYDNYAIMMNDPAYARRLENLPPKKRQAFLHGDWDVYDGQAFEEFDYDIHVLEPFVIPDHWYRWRSADNGYTDPFAWYWMAVDEHGLVYIYREFTREPGSDKLTYTEQAKQVLDLSSQIRIEHGTDYRYRENIPVTFVGHDAFKQHPLSAGKTIAYFYQLAGLTGIAQALPDRAMRKAVWHEYLKPFEFMGKMVARVRIFENCVKLIETLPQLSEDEKDPEKVEESNIDHWYEGSGYGLVSFHQQKSGRSPTPPPQELPEALRTKKPKSYGSPADEYVDWED